MDWALLATTVALTIGTGVYAWFTARMATELRETRSLSVRPQLGVDIQVIGPSHGALRLSNIGRGAALNVDAHIGISGLGDHRDWHTPLLLPGESVQFYPHKSDGSLATMEDAQRLGSVVDVTGTMSDVYGERHDISERVDIGTWWTKLTEAEQAWIDDPAEVANRRLEKITKELEKLRRALERRPG